MMMSTNWVDWEWVKFLESESKFKHNIELESSRYLVDEEEREMMFKTYNNNEYSNQPVKHSQHALSKHSP